MILIATFTIGLAFWLAFKIKNDNRKLEKELIEAIQCGIIHRMPGYRLYLNESLNSLAVKNQTLGLSAAQYKKTENCIRLGGIGFCAIPYELLQPGVYQGFSLAEKYVFEKYLESTIAILELIPSLKKYSEMIDPRYSNLITPDTSFHDLFHEISAKGWEYYRNSELDEHSRVDRHLT